MEEIKRKKQKGFFEVSKKSRGIRKQRDKLHMHISVCLRVTDTLFMGLTG